MNLAKQENQDIEFKQSWRDEYIKWICGFANAKGGTIYIGVDDDGKVVGIANAKKLLEDIPNKVRDLLGIIVDMQMHESGGLEYLEITVGAYPYPVSYKGQYHYRTGSTKQELKGAALDKFLLQKQGRRWDGVPVPYVGVNDLDASTFDRFRNRALKSKRLENADLEGSDEELLHKLLLMEGDYLKRAAVLLFHPEPQRFVTGAYIKIGFFESNADLLYQDVIEGNLFTQVEKTMDLLLTKYLKAMISYEGLQRIEEYGYAPAALREALLNAVVHKDYGSGVPIQISVYEEKLMIWNAGELPQEWTIDTLLGKHNSRPFNPDIANTFFRAGLIESWGRGIEKIIDESRAFNGTEPVFTLDGGLWTEFTQRYPHLGSAGEETTQKTTQEVREKTREKTRDKTRDKILETMRTIPAVTMEELAEQIGISSKGVEWQIQKLKSEGVIRRIGPAKGGHWEVKDAK